MAHRAPLVDCTHRGELFAAARLAARDGQHDVAAYLEGLAAQPAARLGQLGQTNVYGDNADLALTAPDYAARRVQLGEVLDAARTALMAAWEAYNALSVANDVDGAGAIETAAIFYYSLATGAVPESVARAWYGSLMQTATQTVPQLERTIDRAASDRDYTVKWLETAHALASQVEGVLLATKQNPTLDALNEAIAAADRALLGFFQKIVKVFSSPWTWGLLGVGLALIYVPGLVGGITRGGREAVREATRETPWRLGT